MNGQIRRTLRRSAIAVALVVSTVVAVGDPAASAPPARHVVLIGFDGFDPDYLDRVDTPNLDALADRGVHGVTEGVMLPITTPSFTSIATGTWPDQHGTITYYVDRATNTFHTSSPRSTVPTIANAVVDAGGTVGAAQYWAFNGQGAAYGDPDALYTQPGGPCSNMFDDAIAMLRGQPVDSNGTPVTVSQIPTLLGVYCSHLDTVGHDEGADSPNLATTLAELDRQVGRLVDALEEVGIADETAIIVTGDHGMSTYTRRNTAGLNQALNEAGYRTQVLLLQGQTVDPTADVLVVPAAGRATSLYAMGDLEGDDAALQDLASVALGVEGIERVIDRDQQAELRMNPKFGDLVLESSPGWSSGILPMTGPRGDHGSSDEVDAVFFMAGPGIDARAGAVRVCHVNVAPTIAELLGLAPLPASDAPALLGNLDDLDGCALAQTIPEPPTTSTTAPTTSTSTSEPSDTDDAGAAPPPPPPRPVRARPDFVG